LFNITQFAQMRTPKRSFGAIISGNCGFNRELNSVPRAIICSEKDKGRSNRDVGREFHASPSTVSKIWNRWQTEHTFEKKTRSGRLMKLTKAEIKYIILML
ncbi:hypothetical protein EDB80DRAFT_538958, partial [Ilyonectria destructans]